MLLKFTFVVAILFFSFMPFASASAEEEVDLTVLKSIGYEVTGVTKRCILHTRIRRTQVIDDFTIVFHMTGRKTYANIMERKCPGLYRERAIKYQVRGGTLCNVDMIEVMTPSFSGNTCNLGDFYEIEKIEVENPENVSNKEDPVE